jgi:hypothetical protein
MTDFSPLTPVDYPLKTISVASTGNDGGHNSEHTQSGSAPTAPSPPVRQTEPFEMVDDVPSVHSATDDLASQVSQMEISTLHTGIPVTMTPPLTPPTLHAEGLGMYDEGNKKLLTKLGGYGWRG